MKPYDNKLRQDLIEDHVAKYLGIEDVGSPYHGTSVEQYISDAKLFLQVYKSGQFLVEPYKDPKLPVMGNSTSIKIIDDQMSLTADEMFRLFRQLQRADLGHPFYCHMSSEGYVLFLRTTSAVNDYLHDLLDQLTRLYFEV